MPQVAVVVIGDFGRSPRMQYHTLSLVRNGHQVSVIATKGSTPLREIRENPNIKLYLIDKADFEGFPRLIRYVLKTIYQTVLLLMTLLFVIPRPKSILVQNPPSIPTLPCVWFACKIRRSQFILDWHNYGFTILKMATGGIVLRIYRWTEFFFGSKADRHFCVSRAMRDDLLSRGLTNVVVLHDKPPRQFKPIDWNFEGKMRVHNLLRTLSKEEGLEAFCVNDHETILTTMDFCELDQVGIENDGGGNINTENSGTVRLKKPEERPLILFSSTSWTEDEDFSILLEALRRYDEISQGDSPGIICIVTGKGPRKEFYKGEIATSNLRKVTFVTPWLDIADYPLMVSICDVGVCLHTSSSSLDLPMKVVDMFGCCVPVLACRYNCIEELVEPQGRGLLFEDAQQLCQQILDLTCEGGQTLLRQWRANLETWQAVRWDQHWNIIAKPAFE